CGTSSSVASRIETSSAVGCGWSACVPDKPVILFSMRPPNIDLLYGVTQMSLPIHPLTDAFAVAPPLRPDDMQAVADAGYRSGVLSRPEGDGGPGQPASADVIAAARAAGLAVEYQPVVSGAMAADDVARFKQLLTELPAPVLAYCRSGKRCTHLFAAATEA